MNTIQPLTPSAAVWNVVRHMSATLRRLNHEIIGTRQVTHPSWSEGGFVDRECMRLEARHSALEHEAAQLSSNAHGV